MAANDLVQATFPLYILSGGIGASGEQLARTVLAQFEKVNIEIQVFPRITTKKQIRSVLDRAGAANAVVAHTFVNPKLRREVHEYGDSIGVPAIDLVEDLMEALAAKLDQTPLGKPGLYRQLHKSYFDRIQAMNYTLDHDDGKNRGGWAQAEIILLGASRVGKTPLSVYLSVLGWKVANVPLVAGIKPHPSLFALDEPQLVGLTLAPSELIEHRVFRQSELGVSGSRSDYVAPQKVFEEIEAIEKMLKRQRVPLVDVTAKPIETSADEIIRLVRRKQKKKNK